MKSLGWLLLVGLLWLAGCAGTLSIYQYPSSQPLPVEPDPVRGSGGHPPWESF